ncbi:unnamed protein product [Absidia cylindrospora]
MRLSPEMMWTLSSGKKMEQTMMVMAMNCDVEHANHSMIMDPEDEVWDRYFTHDELEEIRDYEHHNNNNSAAPTTLPRLPTGLAEFLDTIESAHSINEAYKLASQQQLDMNDNACNWAKVAVLRSVRLFKKSTTGVINFNDISENDLPVRHFGFISSLFDESMVDGLSGELASKTSKAAMNNNKNKRKCDVAASDDNSNSKQEQ